MQMVNVLNLKRISAADRAKIEAVDPAVNLTDAKARDGLTANIAKLGLPTARHAFWLRVPRALKPARTAIASWQTRKSSWVTGHSRSICALGHRSSNGFISAPRAPAIC